MKFSHSIVAVFDDHAQADAAVKALAASGFGLRRLSIIGKGYHSDQTATGFYNSGDRIRFWGSRGALWGGLWGLFMADSTRPCRWSAESCCSGIWQQR